VRDDEDVALFDVCGVGDERGQVVAFADLG
jgi:hypothetical protein